MQRRQKQTESDDRDRELSNRLQTEETSVDLPFIRNLNIYY